MERFKDLTGQKFNKWTVIEKATRTNEKKQVYWRVRCECGTIAIVRGDALRLGGSSGCSFCTNFGRGKKFNIIRRGA